MEESLEIDYTKVNKDKFKVNTIRAKYKKDTKFPVEERGNLGDMISNLRNQVFILVSEDGRDKQRHDQAGAG